MRRWLGWGAAAAAAVAGGGLAVCFAPLPPRDRLYREISYQFVADRVTAGATSDVERILRLFDYIHLHVNVVGSTVIDETPWNDLVRGIGWCDQQSWGLATLLSKENIDARFAMLRTASGVSPHTVAEVKIADRWALFDALNGLYYRKPDGTFATLEEIVQNPALVAQESKIQRLQPEVRTAFLQGLPDLYPFGQSPKRWTSLLTKKNRSLARRLGNRFIRVTVRALGKPFVHTYQDLYFLTEARRGREWAERRLLQARNYHLYGRLPEAERSYRAVIEQAPQHPRREDAQCYLGILLNDAGRFSASREQLEELLARFPTTRWRAVAQYYLGRDDEAMGDLPQALKRYQQLAGNLDFDGPWRLAELQGLAQAVGH